VGLFQRRRAVSLHRRLLTWLLLLLTVGLAAAAVWTSVLLHSFLVARVDRQLGAVAGSTEAYVAQHAANGKPGLPSFDPRSDFAVAMTQLGVMPAWAELRGPDNRVLRTLVSKDYPLPPLPAVLPVAPVTATNPFGYRFLSIQDRDGGRLPRHPAYRVVVARLPDGRGTFAMGLPLKDVQETVTRLIRTELLVGVAVLLVLALLARRAVRDGLRPLEEIGETARAIGAGDLTQRVEPATERTEVGRLGLALNAMLGQLEAAFQEREASERRLRRFVADASHELRTPLTSIRGYAELFRRGASARPEDLAMAMRRIEEEAARMGVLVDELLLLARLDQGRPLERAPVDLAKLATEAVADARVVEPERPLRLERDGPVVVPGDADRLRQVLANLLANVRQHTPAGTEATVRVAREGAVAVLEVADRGPGLTEEQRERAFERFWHAEPWRPRGQTRQRSRGGAGLGLAIVAAVAAAHGGRASAAEAPGGGASFRVELPLDPDGGHGDLTAISTVPQRSIKPADAPLEGERATPERAATAEPQEGSSLMTSLSNFVLRHKLLVGLFWLVVFVAGGATASKVSGRLSQDFALPGSKSYDANQAILRAYGNGGNSMPLVPVISLPAGTTVDSPGVKAALGQAFAAVARDPRLRVVSYASTGDRRFVSADGRVTFGLVFQPRFGAFSAPDLGPAVTAALQGQRALPAGAAVRVTGLDELAAGNGGGQRGNNGVLAETLLGGVGALAVLAFVFGSLLALLPLVIAAVAILATFLVILGLTAVTDVNFIVQFLVALIGLGVAIDYSLLVVTRWREERAHGYQGDEAVRRAMATAGRAVVFSGLTVAIGLVALVVLPVPFLRSVGFGGMLIPLISVLVAVTLLPVLLATVGRRIDWPRLRREAHASRGWTAWARGVVRGRWVAAIGAVAVLGALGAAAFGLHLGDPRADALAKSGPASEGLVALERAGIPTGVLTPIEVLVPAGTDPARVASRLAAVPGVRDAVAPAGPSWRRGGTALVTVQTADEASTAAGKATVTRVRDAAAAMPGVRVGGSGASLIDGIHAIYGSFPLMLSLIAVLTFVLLVRAFRSLLLPLKAVLLNLVSVGAAYGVIVLVWQRGDGSQALWGIPATGAIAIWIPLMAFAFLYGLSMDYEVFILARMREAYDRGGSTATAIVEGIGRTGRLVTSAALILFLAFASLASSPGTEIKVMATALGAGILLDATVVRALLVPALVSLLGRWNWWLPAWAARPLRLAPSPALPERPAAKPGAEPAAEEKAALSR
jgi:RND superfamily putative drug exporter